MKYGRYILIAVIWIACAIVAFATNNNDPFGYALLATILIEAL